MLVKYFSSQISILSFISDHFGLFMILKIVDLVSMFISSEEVALKSFDRIRNATLHSQSVGKRKKPVSRSGPVRRVWR